MLLSLEEQTDFLLGVVIVCLRLLLPALDFCLILATTTTRCIVGLQMATAALLRINNHADR